MSEPHACDSPAQAGSNTFLPVDEALRRIAEQLPRPEGFEQLALRECLGRILAEPITSGINVPGHDNSAMDGYAIRAADLGAESLSLIGESFAGHPFEGECGPGQAVRIMTGAMIPSGCDTVIMQEQVEREGERIHILGEHKPGENVRLAGEDMAAGEVVLQPGKRLDPAELGLIASLGIAEVRVRRRLRVAFFSTGDELCSLGEVPQEGQIYDSNRYTLYGMLKRLDAEVIDMGVIADIPEAIEAAFNEAAAVADVVLTSGGVSVGDADYVKQTLDKLGQVDFWKIAMKPGKPLAFGRLGKAAFFGLPGNPVSAMATFYQIVQPSLRHMQGVESQPLRLRLPLIGSLKKRPGRTDFQRGVLVRDSDGTLKVHGSGHQGSHILRSMSEADCFIILPAESGSLSEGELVEVEPFISLVG